MKKYDTSELTFDYEKLVKIFSHYSILEEPDQSTEEKKSYLNILTWNDYVINKEEKTLTVYPKMDRQICFGFEESVSILNVLRVITQNQQDFENRTSEADEKIFSILNIRPFAKYNY